MLFGVCMDKPAAKVAPAAPSCNEGSSSTGQYVCQDSKATYSSVCVGGVYTSYNCSNNLCVKKQETCATCNKNTFVCDKSGSSEQQACEAKGGTYCGTLQCAIKKNAQACSSGKVVCPGTANAATPKWKCSGTKLQALFPAGEVCSYSDVSDCAGDSECSKYKENCAKSGEATAKCTAGSNSASGIWTCKGINTNGGWWESWCGAADNSYTKYICGTAGSDKDKCIAQKIECNYGCDKTSKDGGHYHFCAAGYGINSTKTDPRSASSTSPAIKANTDKTAPVVSVSIDPVNYTYGNVIVRAATDENATCKISDSQAASYGQMGGDANMMKPTDTSLKNFIYGWSVKAAAAGTYNLCVRCVDRQDNESQCAPVSFDYQPQASTLTVKLSTDTAPNGNTNPKKIIADTDQQSDCRISLDPQASPGSFDAITGSLTSGDMMTQDGKNHTYDLNIDCTTNWQPGPHTAYVFCKMQPNGPEGYSSIQFTWGQMPGNGQQCANEPCSIGQQQCASNNAGYVPCQIDSQTQCRVWGTQITLCGAAQLCRDGFCVPSGDPKVSDPRPNSEQNSASVKLAVTTDIPATCKYKEGSAMFNFETEGTLFDISDSGRTHTKDITNAKEGMNTFGVLCKGSEQGGIVNVSVTLITFTVNSSSNANEPIISDLLPNTEQNSGNVKLSVTTDRWSTCKYKEASSASAPAFNFETEGTAFDTDNFYLHTKDLQNLANKAYFYAVMCKSNGVTTKNPKFISFVVNNTVNPATETKISNPLPNSEQGTSTVMLSITVDRAAVCKFKEITDSTAPFNYDTEGTLFNEPASGATNYIHTKQIGPLADGGHSYAVKCKGKEQGATVNRDSALITFTVNSAANNLGPVMSDLLPNTTQTSNSVKLSVTTDRWSACKYKETNAAFNFETEGTAFDTDNFYLHTKDVNLNNGPHIFAVMCKGNGVVNAVPKFISFTVESGGANSCANVQPADKNPDETLGNTSNDNDYSQNQGNSDDDGSTDAVYLWQSVDRGTIGSFASVNWYAGYKFTPKKDGNVTQLCGFFNDISARVNLYDSAFSLLASTYVRSADNWNCVIIDNAPVKSGQHYYVVAVINSAPLYYKTKPGMFSQPIAARNVDINEGVWELNDEQFGTNLRTNTNMVLGLVDVKIAFGSSGSGENQRPPLIKNPQAVASDSANSAKISVQTDENATCKFDRWNRSYDDMRYTFAVTGGMVHEQKVCDLGIGRYTYFVKCKDGDGNKNRASVRIRFWTGSGGITAVDELSIFNARQTTSASAASQKIEVETSTEANCKYDTEDRSYNSMRQSFDETGRKIHGATLGQMNSGRYDYYVRCQGIGQNGDTSAVSAKIIVNVENSASDTVAPEISNTLVDPASANAGARFRILSTVKDAQGIKSVVAKIHSSESTGVTTLSLFDNGVDDDEHENNGVFGADWDSTGKDAGRYDVDIVAYDKYDNSSRQTEAISFTVQ